MYDIDIIALFVADDIDPVAFKWLTLKRLQWNDRKHLFYCFMSTSYGVISFICNITNQCNAIKPAFSMVRINKWGYK